MGEGDAAMSSIAALKGAASARPEVPGQPTVECRSCGTFNEAGAHYCDECGTRLDARCPACRTLVRPGRKYCGNCGTAVAQRTARPQVLQPDQPLPEDLGSRSAAREGERKQVTVLFADIKGSLELLAERDPEDARQLIQPILERMICAVHRYEGTVNQILGDGIMALFGAPAAHEDHALHACQAALDMHADIRAYGETLHRAHGLPLIQVRIGLNSGEALVGSLGNDVRTDYTAVGQTTYLAARMEQLASPGATLLTSATLQLVDGYVAVRPHGPVNVKGLRDPVEVYELTGRGIARSRLRLSAVRGLSTFVGRDQELASLERALERAANGRGQVLALVGEPGIGKSRLAREFTRSHRTRGWGLAETRCLAYGTSTAYQPVTHLLRAYFHIAEQDDAARIREKVTQRVLALDPGLRTSVPALLGLLDAARDDPEWMRLDPMQRRQRILDAGRRLLLRESHNQPLVLVFEDLHWVDSETQALLGHLVDSLPQERILLLLTYRPGYQPPWAGRSHFSEVRIDPMCAEIAAAMADTLLGGDDSLQSVKRLLLARTDGNPLFLEESVRALEETGAIAGERGAYRLCAPLTGIQVPATVQAILAARIDRLPEQHKHLLQCASILGKDVPLALLQAISRRPEEQVRSGLEFLQAAGFMYETASLTHAEYTFKHALTQEVAYGSVLLECRKALHRAVVEAIETLHAARLHEHTESLAHHALRGELWDKAAVYARRSGARAIAQSANREAVTAFDRALHALRHLPEKQDTIEQAIDVRCELRNALYPLAGLGRLYDLLREAERLGEMIEDGPRRERVASYLTHYLWATGRHREALAIGKRSLPRGPLDPHASVQLVASNWVIGQAHLALGDHPAAVAFFDGMLRRVEVDSVGSSFGSHGLPVVFARSWMTRALAELGRFEEGIACANEALRIAEVLDHPFSIYVGNQGLGYLHLRRGAVYEALPFLQRSCELCKEWNLTIGHPTAEALLGYALMLSGYVSEGTHMLSRALDESRGIGVLFTHALETAWLAEAYLRGGNRELARGTAEYAMQVAIEQETLGYQAWILRLQGEIAAKGRGSEEARQHLEGALQLARSLQMRPLAEQCARDLAALQPS
jgi:class 3 adenylate cyclase/tetratricopeptide (TPR) repeat protein